MKMIQQKGFLMKRYTLLLLLIFAFFFSSCAAIYKGQRKAAETNKAKLSKVVASAVYDISNIDLFLKPENFEGKILSFSGIVYYEPYLEPKEKIFSLKGSVNGNLINVVVYLDNEMPVYTTYTDEKELLSRGKSIRMFGIYKGIGEYMREDGISMKAPEIRAIAIYNSDDSFFKTPIWTAEAYM